MFKKIITPNWHISYVVYQKKVIELLFCAKNGELVGWNLFDDQLAKLIRGMLNKQTVLDCIKGMRIITD